jgi:myo-inositol 2-dehydrogenase/D-chiro-inositol 1-dehydrogenase
VQLGFMRVYDPAHTQLLGELSAVGTIDYVRAVHRNANTSRRPIEQIIGQSMVHDIHSVRFVTGCEITDVRAFGSGPAAGSFRHVLAVCTLSSGAHAAIEFDDGGFAYDVTLEVLGRQSDVLIGPPTRAITRRNGSLDVHLGTDWFGWFADAYRIQDQAWVDSIRAGLPVGPTVWDGVIAQAVVDAILTSLATNATVTVATFDPDGA